MEKLPQSKKVEKETNPEERSHMWGTIRLVALSGLVMYGAYKDNSERIKEIMQQKPTEISQKESLEKPSEQIRKVNEEDFKKELGREITDEEKASQKIWEKKFGGISREDRGSMIISGVSDRGTHIENGKIIQETTVTTEDGKTYETRAETDADSSSLVDSRTGDLRIGGSKEIKSSWDRSFVSSVEKDGSGFKVVYEATKEGLKTTIQELGPNGSVLSERVSLLQEK